MKTLVYWPPLPLVLDYGGSPALHPPAVEDEDNIVAAFNQSDRVRTINLTITRSLQGKLSTISESFSELEELVLLSEENARITLLSTFRWGPLLRSLHATRIAFPSFPQLLLPSRGLVDLQLHEIPRVGYFSPEAFANALSGMTQLRSLFLHFLSLPTRRNYLRLPPTSWERVALPALTCLKFRGTSKYLDSLVARIDAPNLRDIDITLFHQPTMDASQLGLFIDRVEKLTPARGRADILTSERAISLVLYFTQIEGFWTRLKVEISCEQFDWQLSSMTQVCKQLSPFLFCVKDLGVNITRPSSRPDDIVGGQWLELVRTFGGTEDLRVCDEVMTDVLRPLHPAQAYGDFTTLFPFLRNLHIEEPSSVHAILNGRENFWDLVESFVAQRRLSGYPLLAHTPWSQYSCTNCVAGFKRRQEFNRHIKDKHPRQNICPHCGSFDWPQGRDDLFRHHLVFAHPGK